MISRSNHGGAGLIGPNKGGTIKNLGEKSIKEIEKWIKAQNKIITEHIKKKAK